MHGVLDFSCMGHALESRPRGRLVHLIRPAQLVGITFCRADCTQQRENLVPSLYTGIPQESMGTDLILKFLVIFVMEKSVHIPLLSMHITGISMCSIPRSC